LSTRNRRRSWFTHRLSTWLRLLRLLRWSRTRRSRTLLDWHFRRTLRLRLWLWLRLRLRLRLLLCCCAPELHWEWKSTIALFCRLLSRLWFRLLRHTLQLESKW